VSDRSAQALAGVLGVLLVVLVSASIFLLLNQHAPRSTLAPVTAPPSPSVVGPSSVASAATPSLPPTSELSASPPPSSPSVTTSSETPTPTPTVTASPTPTPTLNPTSPQRELQVTDLGLDNHDPEIGSVARYVSFSVDGQSLISARLTSISAGPVRMCLWKGDDVTNKLCAANERKPKIEQAVFDSGTTTWHLSLIGANNNISPYVTLVLDFNADAPSVHFDNLRFLGTPMPDYNGVAVTVATEGSGTIAVSGTFDPVPPQAYRVVIDPSGFDQTGGSTTGFSLNQPVDAGTSYQVTIENPNTQVEQSPVFLSAIISWP
jgi:hypothetical protein